MYSDAELTAIRKAECEISGLYFTRYFFKQRFGSKMLINWHHELIQSTLQKVIDGKIKRLIINIPPGYTKTELATINFMARGLAINPQSRFLHLSYSSSLALENSSTARNIIKSEAYQAMWDLRLKDDSDSKQKWWTEQGGGVYATAAGGQVTGFRAGHMSEGFNGALIIDDPVKPDDAFYEERIKVNNRFNETIKSRLATEDVPIIVIMQRIHKNDLAGYLLRGGSGEKWHHLNLPVFIDNEKYPKEYTHGIEIKYKNKNGWLWEAKHTEKNRKELMSHKRTWFSQYLQKPELFQIDNALWTEDMINQHRVHEITSPIVKSGIGVDPSGDDGKEDSKSDAIGQISACKCKNGHYYVFLDTTMNGSPAEWASKAVNTYHDRELDVMVGEKNYGGAMVEYTIRTVPRGKTVHYKDVTASRGKLLRAEPIAALYEQGLVHHYGHLYALEEELTTFDGQGKSPNRLDALVWILTELSNNYVPEQEAPECGI
jgi:hypothetical protein